MKLFVSVLVLATLVLSLSVAPASAGWKEKAEARRAALAEKPDSKALCPILAPWPWKCGGADFDSDGDGVMDGKDQCPGTPLGAVVDKKGCPVDSDKDGVPDGIDKCPNTPAGAKVDETGCPADVKAFIDTGKIVSTKILFDSGKATLRPESKQELDAIGAVLAQCADMKIEIAGHTDSQGADDLNLKLSEERAAAVRDYILKNFSQCKPDLFVSKGYGETKPVATNATAEGRQRNRRVEFSIVK